MTFSLPEDLHPIEFAPTKNQANSNGEVMFYAEGYGWYSGHFSRPHMPSTTHWTLLPDRRQLLYQMKQDAKQAIRLGRLAAILRL